MPFEGIINKTELQKLQDEFCEVTGLYVYCLDADKLPLSQISGNREQLSKIAPYFECAEMMRALDRVYGDSLEDQAIENLTDEKGKVAAVAIRPEKKETVLYWLVVSLSQTTNIRFAGLEQALDLLRDGSNVICNNLFRNVSAQIKSRKSENERQKMEQSIATIEATTAVVSLLDSDEPIETIMESWLEVVCNYLKVDTAEIFSLYGDMSIMDVTCEWLREDAETYFESKQGIPSYVCLRTDKPVVLSGEGLTEVFGEELNQMLVKSIMIFPILKQEKQASLVLTLNHRSEHSFSMEEIKFAADVVKVLQSILTKRIQKNSLASSFAALEAVLDNVGSAVYVEDSQTKEGLFANGKFQRGFAVQMRKRTLQKFLDDGVEKAKGRGYSEVFCAEQNKWYDLTYKDITWVDGSIVKLYTLYEITDKKLYQTKIEQLAYTDFLTGLYNRMCCERDLERFIHSAEAEKKSGALFYLDLDDFKHINDGLGHEYGDVLLQTISKALQSIEEIKDTCYRVGGDEFVIIIPPEVYDEFEDIIDQIKGVFSRPWFLKDTEYYCTMSMGIVGFPEEGKTVSDLIKKADIAMYEAKKGGKNRVASYNDSIYTVSGRRLDMEKNMRDAATGDLHEFLVYYQPVIDVQKEEIECAGAEALIRWNSPNLGFVSPAEFIPLAEYLGLINPIGTHILRQACMHCKTWNENGYPDYKVNVNLSVVQLVQPDILDIIADAIKETGINPKNLTLEVTESLAINDMEKMKKILSGIKALGVKLALDDFGTGYSSLNHIREIPFDVIKVDQSFVKNLAEDAFAKSFVKMVSELAEAVGMNICVEGIETINQYAALRGMKVKYIQGYFFDKPMAKKEFETKYVQ